MGLFDALIGKSRATQETPKAEEAAPAQGVQAPAEAAPEQSAISTDQPQEQTFDQDGVPAKLNTPLADPQQEAWRKELLDAFHLGRQRDADKLKTANRADQDAETAKPQVDKAKGPTEIPRAVYKNHIQSAGKFDPETAQGLADVLPEIVNDMFQKLAGPILEDYNALKQEVAEFRGMKSQYADQEWNGVRSSFGAAADQYRKDVETMARSKGISKRAALIELAPHLIGAAKQAQRTQADASRPNSLRSAVAATPGAFARGDEDGAPVQELEDIFRTLKKSAGGATRQQK